jgi:hypothetical protein
LLEFTFFVGVYGNWERGFIIRPKIYRIIGIRQIGEKVISVVSQFNYENLGIAEIEFEILNSIFFRSYKWMRQTADNIKSGLRLLIIDNNLLFRLNDALT